MSAWLEAAREVHAAGGRMPVARMAPDRNAIAKARRQGLLTPGSKGGRRMDHWVALTPHGRAALEGRVQKVDARLGPPWQATWLAALPLPNAVRLSPGAHFAPSEGTGYW